MGYNLQQAGGMWSLQENCQVHSQIKHKLYKPDHVKHLNKLS